MRSGVRDCNESRLRKSTRARVRWMESRQDWAVNEGVRFGDVGFVHGPVPGCVGLGRARDIAFMYGERVDRARVACDISTQHYTFSKLGNERKYVEARAAWGLMPPPDYASTLAETLERDYIPLFGAVDVDARRAWDSLL